MANILTITLYMSELLYDFRNKAYLTGRSRRADGKDAEFTSNMQASEDEADNNQVLRSIQNAYGQLLVELSEGFLDVTEKTSKNELMTATNITLVLQVPSNYNLGVRDSLTSAIHDYLINKALMDWFMMTNKDDAKDYADLATVSFQNIRNAFNRRVRPKRTEVS